MKLRYAEIRMWREDETLAEWPSEIVGICLADPRTNDDPEPSAQFAAEVIRRHWKGDCDCMKEKL